jgi:hypothetical protein
VTCPELELTSKMVNPFRHFGRAPWIRDRPILKPVPTQEDNTEKRADSYMPQVGSEPTFPVFDRSKTGVITVKGKGKVVPVLN